MKIRTTYLTIAFLVLVGMFAVGCDLDLDGSSPTEPEPVAGFSVTVNAMAVQIQDESLNSDAWRYTWGDASGATVQRNPTHVYASGGQYVIRQTACRGDDFFDEDNCDDISATVTIEEEF